MMKKVLFCILIIPSFPACSMNDLVANDTAVVVAHGFGGSGGKDKTFVKQISSAFGILRDDCRHAPSFPDAGGCYSRTVLYTRPAVLVLVQELLDVLQSGKTAIHLVAHSCGGGIVINMLAHLTHYEKNKDYFKDTGITLENAQAIIEALKKGSINITAPLLTAEKSRTIMHIGIGLSVGTCMASAGGIYYVIADKVKNFLKPHVGIYVRNHFTEAVTAGLTQLGFVGVGLGVYYWVGKELKNMYIKGGVRYIMPLVSHYNFDPLHPTPLELLDMLEDRLITRVHICAYDEIVDISPEDIEKLRLKAAAIEIVDGTDHCTITNSLHEAISKTYCCQCEQESNK